MQKTLPNCLISIFILFFYPLYTWSQEDSSNFKSKIIIKSQIQVGNEKKQKIIERELDGQEDISIFLDSMFGNNGIRFNSIEILRQHFDDMPRVLDSLLEGLSEFRGLNMDHFFRQLPAPQSKPFLGLVFEDVEAEEEIADQHGITVTRIVPGSAAEEAGLQAGDIIVMADDKPVNDIPTIQQIVSSKNIGDKLSIQFERDGHLGSTVAILKAKQENSSDWGLPSMPDPGLQGFNQQPKCDKIILQKPGPRLGISVTNLTEEARTDLRVKKGGVLVTKVEKGSSAAAMGLSINDVITSINGVKITSPEQLKNILSGISLGNNIVIEYVRYGKKKKTSGTLHEYSRAWD